MSSGTIAWSRTGDGKYTHPYGAMEKAYLTFCDPALFHGHEYYVEFYTCYFEANRSLPVHETLSRLKAAWLALRYYNPAISTSIEGNDMVYSALNEATAQKWLEDTFITVDDPKAAPETLASSLSPSLAQSELYYFQQQSAVSLRMSHWRIGLSGMTTLFNRFFRYFVAQPILTWGREVSNLRTRFDENVDLIGEPSKEAQAYVADIFSKVFAAGDISGFPVHGDPLNTVPKTSKFFTFMLDASTTKALTAATRANGDTVTALFHAALTQTVFDFAPSEWRDRKQVIALFRDLRRFSCVPSPYNGEDYAVDNPLVGEAVVLDRSDYQSVTDLVTYFTKQYHTEFDQELSLSATNVYVNFMIGILNAMIQSTVEGKPPSPSTMPRLSSVGVLEKYLNTTYSTDNKTNDRTKEPTEDALSVRITDITVQAEHTTRETTFWLYSFGDKLRLTAGWNEAFFDEDFMRAVCDKIFSYVSQATGVNVKYQERQPGK